MTYYIFTDGGAKRNADKTYKASQGICVVDVTDCGDDQYNHELIYESSGTIINGTNNRGELSAIVSALMYIKLHKLNNARIISDSEYSIKSIIEWGPQWRDNPKKEKGKLNLDLIYKGIDLVAELRKAGVTLTFEHVNSHIKKKDIPTNANSLAWIKWFYNDKVDKLCTLSLL